MNHYAGWKNALIAVFLFISVLYALPNIFGSDLSVQISSTGENPITESDAEKVESILRKENIQAKSVDVVNRRVLVRFNDSETQLNAKEILKEELGRNYVTALNLAPAIPNWLSSLGGKAMSLGLDLRGGVHFLLEVDMNEVVRMANDRYYNELRNLLREDRLYKRIKIENQSLNVEYKTSNAKLKGDELVRKDLSDLVIKDNVESNSNSSIYEMSDNAKRDAKLAALKQNITTLRNRVNELGVAEPIIQQQGLDRIVVQLPGVQDTARAKEILGAVATLEFRLVDEKNDPQTAIQTGKVPLGSKLFYFKNGTPLLLKTRVIATGENITGAASGVDQESNSPMVNITLDNAGGRAMLDTTKKHINERMAVVFIENKVESLKKWKN